MQLVINQIVNLLGAKARRSKRSSDVRSNNPMCKRILASALVCALFLFFGVAGLAQELTVKGNVGGVVVDSTGAVVPGAKVTLTGPMGNLTTPSDSEGNFLFVRLDPGNYSLKVEQKGFKLAEVKGITVVVGRKSNL